MEGANSTATGATFSLPVYQTAIFIVVLLGEFVASLIGNIILTAMIVKTRKFQNTINVFLTAFELSYLCSMLMMVTTVFTLASGEWMFGKFVCLLQKQIMAVTVLATPVVHLLLSREILGMAIEPCKYKTNIKRVTLNIVFTWVVMVASLSIVEALYFDADEDDTLNLCSPFIITNHEKEAIILAYCMIVTTGIAAVLAVTLRNYYKVIRPEPSEPHPSADANGLLAETSNIEFDKERVKAILPAFVVQFVSTVAACLWSNYILLYNMISGLDETHQPRFECTFNCIAVLPAVSPVIFIFSSAKYRNHVGKLCPCCIRPLRVYIIGIVRYWIPISTRSNRIYQSKIRATDSPQGGFDSMDPPGLGKQVEIGIDLNSMRYWPNTVHPKTAWSDDDYYG